MNMIFMALLTAIGGGDSGGHPLAYNPVSTEAEVVLGASDSTIVKLRIEGMTCGACAISVRIVLERLEGVRQAQVTYDEKTATVTYDPAKTTPTRMIVELKDKLKYTATIIEPRTSRSAALRVPTNPRMSARG